MKAIRMHEPGPPEVLKLEEVATPTPGPGEVLVKVEVAGVNYADTGMRQGMFGGPHGPAKLPATPGFEVAGTVAAIGEGVEGFEEGDRVAAVLESGGYAGYAVAPAMMLVRVPEGVELAQATALLVGGITAYGILHDSARLQKAETVLVMAAAGGVGHLAVQLAKLAGAGKVVAAAGSDEKRELALSLGADHAIDYTQADWTDQVREATGGRGVDVVLESVGGELGAQAYATLAPLGRFVTFGAASGPLAPPDMMQLAFQGLAVMGFGGPWVRPGRAQAAQAEISGYLESGELRVVADRVYPLAEASTAHRAVEERKTIGKVILTVDGAGA